MFLFYFFYTITKSVMNVYPKISKTHSPRRSISNIIITYGFTCRILRYAYIFIDLKTYLDKSLQTNEKLGLIIVLNVKNENTAVLK